MFHGATCDRTRQRQCAAAGSQNRQCKDAAVQETNLNETVPCCPGEAAAASFTGIHMQSNISHALHSFLSAVTPPLAEGDMLMYVPCMVWRAKRSGMLEISGILLKSPEISCTNGTSAQTEDVDVLLFRNRQCSVSLFHPDLCSAVKPRSGRMSDDPGRPSAIRQTMRKTRGEETGAVEHTS